MPIMRCRMAGSVLRCLPVLFLLLLSRCINASVIDRIIPSNYDNYTRPLNLSNPQPVLVSVTYRLNLLYNIDSRNENWALDLFLTEQWNDYRLQFDPTAVGWPGSNSSLLRVAAERVWKPDTFFFNAISCKTADSAVTLTSDGNVTWARHQSCVLYSPFDLSQFPFDTQNLYIQRLSFTYSSREVQVQFHPDGCFQPTSVSDDYSSSLWQLNSATCTDSSYLLRDGQPPYSMPVVYLSLTRMEQNYLLKYIAPIFLIVLVSTISYWIDLKSPPARVSFSVSLVLSIVTFNLLVSQDLPKINYNTLLDWYVWLSFMWVIMGVAEFAAANHFMISKTRDPAIGWAFDDFSQWTMTPVWCLVNVVYWPIIENKGGNVCIGLLIIAYVVANVYRAQWNYHNKTAGMIKPVKQLVRHIRIRFCNYRPAEVTLQDNDDVEGGRAPLSSALEMSPQSATSVSPPTTAALQSPASSQTASAPTQHTELISEVNDVIATSSVSDMPPSMQFDGALTRDASASQSDISPPSSSALSGSSYGMVDHSPAELADEHDLVDEHEPALR